MLNMNPLIHILLMDLNLFSFQSNQFLLNFQEQPSQKNFQCEVCSEIFRSSKGLDIHTTKIHTEPLKKFFCKKCCKYYLTIDHLKAHKKFVHKKLAKVLCSKCEKFFCNKTALARHAKKFHPCQASIN